MKKEETKGIKKKVLKSKDLKKIIGGLLLVYIPKKSYLKIIPKRKWINFKW